MLADGGLSELMLHGDFLLDEPKVIQFGVGQKAGRNQTETETETERYSEQFTSSPETTSRYCSLPSGSISSRGPYPIPQTSPDQADQEMEYCDHLGSQSSCKPYWCTFIGLHQAT